MTFVCKDGQQLCSRQTLGQSDFLYIKANKMTNFENPLKFHYPNHSKAAVKFFLDSLHQIKPGPVDLPTVLEVVDFAYYEGKTTYNSFERCLVGRLMDPIMEKSLPVGTELLIAAYLSRVDNFVNTYQEKVARKLTNDSVTSLLYDFDCSTKMNQCLIAICVSKRIFWAENQNFVTVSLMMFGKKLQELQNAVSESESKSAATVVQYKFTQEEFFPRTTMYENQAIQKSTISTQTSRWSGLGWVSKKLRYT